jgi:hypothetical protein
MRGAGCGERGKHQLLHKLLGIHRVLLIKKGKGLIRPCRERAICHKNVRSVHGMRREAVNDRMRGVAARAWCANGTL